MIRILDKYYTCSPKEVKRATTRLLNGDELTMNSKRKEAYINWYMGENSEQVGWDYADLMVKLGIVECHSGNSETGERHYNFNSRYDD